MQTKYLKIKQLRSQGWIPFSIPTLYRLIAKGKFPAPIKIGRSSYWKLDEVQAAMQVFADARPQ